ncbi:MAG: hypothetical protein U0531_03405 [Dehalococcoidia bacterium]
MDARPAVQRDHRLRAHRPSFRKLLEVLRPLTRGRVITVFGSAGERAPGSRPAWARWRPTWPTSVYWPTEDPRFETRRSSSTIATAMRERGRVEEDATSCVCWTERRHDRHGGGGAARGDIVVLAGEGTRAIDHHGVMTSGHGTSAPRR